MVTRVIGIPDRNGIITIACGGDIIEIHVANGPVPAARGNDPTNPFKDPFTLVAQDLRDNPFRLPSAAIVSTEDGGKIDSDSIVRRVLDQMADQAQTDPSAVVLGMPKVNLHELSDLGRKIAKEAPGIPIAVDFGDLLKP